MNGPQPSEEPRYLSSQSDSVGAGLDFTNPNSRLAPLYFETPHVLAVLLIFFFGSLGTFIPLWHTDVWAHLKYGEWMIEHQAVPTEEPFSPWWNGQIPFTQFYTVSQLAMVAVYRAGAWIAGGDQLNQMAGGVDALRTLHGVLLGVRLLVLWFAFRRVAGSISTAVSGLVVVVVIESINIAVFRPQVFGQLYFASLLLFLSGPRRWLTCLLLPLLFALWANTHGSFIVGLALLFLALLGEVAEQLWVRSNPIFQTSVQQLIVGLFGSVLAIGVLNPYGFSFFSRTLALTSHSSLNLGITEWQPLSFSWSMDYHVFLMATLLLLAVTFYRSPVLCPVFHWLIILVFASGMALQQRFVIWWAMLVPWILMQHWGRLQSRVEEPAQEPSLPSLRKTLLAVAVAWSLIMWSTPIAWMRYQSPTPLRGGVSSGTPWELAQVLRGNDYDSRPEWAEKLDRIIKSTYPSGRFCGSVFASPSQGDFLLWAIAPDIPVTYTHMHLFPPELWRELGGVAAGQPGWRDTLDRYGVNCLVFEPMIASELLKRLKNHPDWLIVLDETESKEKAIPYNRQVIAVRLKPVQPKFTEWKGGR